ncbi:acyltransferase [Pyramidobacter sp. SM-530-WT-4B]|uniref:Acyltransferase n=1 Tax=Pyramidobacter porci TaxID=2605789 RepID=A0A6L5YDV4_9BACT|nr:acyltransferase family protein [Pyramidobacter porci]MST56360.1 acyltransferase [Pyramidobacter porci]
MNFTKDDTLKVKGSAIILMLIHHCFLAPDRYKGQAVIFYPFTEQLVNYFALAMKICVALFTFLSAYGIFMSYKKKSQMLLLTVKDIHSEMARRTTTLLGGYVFVFFLVQLYSVLIIRGGRYAKIYGHGIKSALYFLIDSLGLAELFRTPTFLATFWYLSLALVIIALMPILIAFYKRFGTVSLLSMSVLCAVFFPVSSKCTFAYLPHYAFCVALGIATADHNWLCQFRDWKPAGARGIGKMLKATLILVFITLFLYWRQVTRYTPLLPIWDGVVSFLTIALMFEFINPIPLLGNSLKFLGIHSMNVFLIHNFVRVVWYYKFTYSFKYAWLIVIVLLAVSSLLSVCIEWLKNILGYSAMIGNLRNKAAAMAAKKEKIG